MIKNHKALIFLPSSSTYTDWPIPEELESEYFKSRIFIFAEVCIFVNESAVFHERFPVIAMLSL
jgi:hypothetical protein